MAKITIGREQHYIPILNFVALERAWPFIEEAMQAMSPMVGVRAGLCIIAAGVMERDDFDPQAYGIDVSDPTVITPILDREEQVFDLLVRYFKKKLLSTEIGEVRLAINDILKEAGLVGEEGELEAPGTVNLSSETSDQSSLNLLPPGMKEAAGTA